VVIADSIQDNIAVHFGIRAQQALQEGDEILGAIPFLDTGNRPATMDLQGGKELDRPAPFVVVGTAPDLVGTHRNHGPGVLHRSVSSAVGRRRRYARASSQT